MPSWCLNTLTVEGPDERLDALLTAAHDPAPAGRSGECPFSLERLLPTPPGLLEGGGEAWYHWRLEHWGTKWDLEQVRVEREPGRTVVTCLSAYPPPLLALQSLSGRYPALRFAVAYEEPCVGFTGEVSFQAGECLDAWERETDEDDSGEGDQEDEEHE